VSSDELSDIVLCLFVVCRRPIFVLMPVIQLRSQRQTYGFRVIFMIAESTGTSKVVR
jgi:hypothetical protein